MTAAPAADGAPPAHLRGSLGLLAGSVLASGIDFAVQIVLVRYLTKADFGAWSYALAIAALLATLAQVEMRQVVSRFVPVYLEAHRPGRVRGAVALALGVVLVLGTLLAAGLAVVVSLVGLEPTSDPAALTLLPLVALLIPLQAVDAVVTGVFAAIGASRAVIIRQSLVGPGLRAVVVALLIISAGPVSMLALGTVVATAIAVGLYALALRPALRRHLDAARDRSPGHAPGDDGIEVRGREMLAFAFTLLSSTLVWTLIESSDAVLLGYFGNAETVASFRVVLPLARLNLLAAATFGVLYLSNVSRAHAAGDHSEVSSVYWRTAQWMTLLTMPIFLLTASFAPAVTTGLYGDQYAASAPILAILAVGYFVSTALGFNGQTLKVHGRLRYMVFVDLGAVVVNIVANLALIPVLGAVGAAIATTATLVAHNLLKQAGLARFTRVPPMPRSTIGIYIVVAAAGAALFALQILVPTTLLAAVVLSLAAGGVTALAFRRRLAVEQVLPELLAVPLPAALKRWLWGPTSSRP